MKTTSGRTRREFLEGGLFAATAMTLPMPALAANPSIVPLYAVIHDTRFAASRAFAAEAQRQGALVKAIHEKVHDLWHDDLHHQWNARPMALAGMTTHDALFLLDMMGREVGMRVIYRAHHMLGADGDMARHTAFGARNLLSRHPALRGPERLWARTSAQIVTAWPAFEAAKSSSRSTIDEASRHAIGRDTLVTWLMVPPSRFA